MQFKIKMLALPLLVLASCLNAGTESRNLGGSIVVFAYSQSEIVVAADSRISGANGYHRDDYCKILALDDRLVFTGAGVASHTTPSGQVVWDAFKEASKAFHEAREKRGGANLPKASATGWGTRMVGGINEALKIDQSSATESMEDNRFVTGEFMGFESSSAAIYQVELMFDPGTRQAKQTLTAVPMRPTLRFGMLGRSEIAREVLADKSDFGKAAWQKWIKSESRIPAEDRDVRLVMYLAQRTVTHSPKEGDVGGSIDALKMTRKGIRWIKRKPGCVP